VSTNTVQSNVPPTTPAGTAPRRSLRRTPAPATPPPVEVPSATPGRALPPVTDGSLPSGTHVTAPVEGVDESVRGGPGVAPSQDSGDDFLGAEVAPEAAAATPLGVPAVATQPGVPAVATQPGVPAVAPQSGVPAVAAPQGPSNGLEGEWSADDLSLPRLIIVAGSGELSKKFPSGAVILNDEVFLNAVDPSKGEAGAPKFRFVPVHMSKSWREKLADEDRAAGLTARIVKTAEEVWQLGGTTEWQGENKPTWEPTARIVMLIERPATSPGADHPAFVFELDKTMWATAVFYAGGTSYRTMAKVIFNAASSLLTVPRKDAAGNVVRDGRGAPVRDVDLSKVFWTWTTTKREAGKYVVTAPEVRAHSSQETGPELKAFARQLLESIG
jgi:hypothetical protein